MALLTILEYPDPRLRKIAQPVAAVTPEIRKLVRDMAETMYAAPGVGLAATQVDVHKRVIVMDISEARDDAARFHQSRDLSRPGEAECEEGCLSVPGYYDKVTRAAPVRVRARRTSTASPSSSTPTGCSPSASSTKWTTCVGKVFVDHLSPLKRARLTARAAQEAAARRLIRASASPARRRSRRRRSRPLSTPVSRFRSS